MVVDVLEVRCHLLRDDLEVAAPVYGIEDVPPPLETLLYAWQHTLVDVSPYVLPMVVAAAVGWARPADASKNGVIMEFHDKATRDEAERMVVHMLEEAFRVRGEAIRDMKVFAAEHTVERTGCALAAITLLGDDDLV